MKNGGRHMLEDTKDIGALRRRHRQLAAAHLGLRQKFQESAAKNKRISEQIEDEKTLRRRAESDLREERAVFARERRAAISNLEIAARRLTLVKDHEGAAMMRAAIENMSPTNPFIEE